MVTVVRKPPLRTVTSCCIEHGTSALNINAGRLGFASVEDLALTKLKNPGRSDVTTSGVYGANRPQQKVTSSGRWPSNLILQHKANCQQTGTTTSPGYTINRWKDGAKPFGGGAGHEYESTQQPDESVVLWECVEGCGVAGLGEQSGWQKDGVAVNRNRRGVDLFGPNTYGTMLSDGRDQTHGGEGTAARYFKQVQVRNMQELPQELVEYLETMITPPDGEVLVALNMDEVPWETYEDQQLHGFIGQGDPTPHMEEIWRVLRPGAFVAMIAPDSEPTGHTGACALEDKGFEMRDAIIVVQEPGRIHYIAKCSTADRNAGIVPFERKVKE